MGEGEIEKRYRVTKRLEGRTPKNKNEPRLEGRKISFLKNIWGIEVQFSVRECEGYIK